MRVAIVGATGAVGQELIKLLHERSFPLTSLTLYASARSEGREMVFGNHTLRAKTLPKGGNLSADVVFSSAGTMISRNQAWNWSANGAVVIDNTSAWRMDDRCPLVIPEINGETALGHRGIVANPNCSTIVALMALAPLHREFGLKRATVATYQAVSGAGTAGIEELKLQSRAFLSGEKAIPKTFQHPIAFNLFSHDSEIGEDGYNVEERKLLLESRKILGEPELMVSATCVRVPVFRAHSEAIHAEFSNPITAGEAKKVLASAPGVTLVDDRPGNTFPTPLMASGKNDVIVGRIRQDVSNPSGIALFVAGDQIRKGAALNAEQIAEFLLARGSIG
jgi:aspartate-semialdehyde dehydrogenase